MTGSAPLTIRAVGLALVAVGATGLVRQRRRAPADLRRRREGGPPAVVARVVGGYNRSGRGRALGRRLRAAGIDMPPTTFLRTQLTVLAPVAFALDVAGVAALAALTTALVAVRGGSWLLLRGRRHRRGLLVEAAASVIAQELATGLAAGLSPAEALSAVQRAPSAVGRAVAVEVCATSAERVAVGTPLDRALAEAAGAEPDPRARRALLRLSVAAGLTTAAGAGTGALQRLSDELEAGRRTRAEVGAAVAEVRTAAVAIPILTAVIWSALAMGDPVFAEAAGSVTLGPLVVAAALMAAVGAVLVRRVTRT